MSRISIIDKNFFNKLEEGGVLKWCEKRDTYNKAKNKFQKCEGKIHSLVKPKMSYSEFRIFKKALELFKGAIYDMELEEKIFYFKEGQKYGMQTIKELYK